MAKEKQDILAEEKELFNELGITTPETSEETPETPEKPEVPEKPETPETPEKPEETPETPEKTETPEKPEAPKNPILDTPTPDFKELTGYDTKEVLDKAITDFQLKIKGFEEQKPINLYEDDTLFKLAKTKTDNPDKYETYSKLLFGGLSALDTLKLQFVASNPDYKDKPEQVERYLKNQYKDFYSDDFTDKDNEYQDAKIQMEVNARIAKESLLKEFNTIEVPENIGEAAPVKSEEDIKAETSKQTAKIVAQWQPAIQEFKKDFTSINIQIGEKEFVKIDIEEKEQLKYLSNTADFILKSNLDYSDEKKTEVKTILENMAFIARKEDIIKAIVSRITGMKDEEYANLYHNPSSSQQKDVNPKNGVISDFDKSTQEILELEG